MSAAIAAAAASVSPFQRRTVPITGLYTASSARLIGFFASGRMRPRMNSTIKAGTNVTESSDAPAIAKVFVQANGLNRRPSCASSAKIGRNETVTISRLKNSEGPTSAAASTSTRARGASGARSMCLCAFSIMTIAASTMAPIAIARPPRLMMLEPMPKRSMSPIAIRSPTGSTAMATRALRAWNRNTAQTSATTRNSSSNVDESVSIARLMRSDRS